MQATMEETRPCTCGCGERVRGQSLYRPGHDSRHASRVGHAVAFVMTNGIEEKKRDKKVADLLSSLPSSQLVDRANRIATNDLSRGRVNPFTRGKVRVGDKEYDAILRPDESVVYFKNDRELPASRKAAESFKAK